MEISIKSLTIQTVFRERNLVCANFLLWDKEAFSPYTELPQEKIPIVLILNGNPRQPYENRVNKVFQSTSKLKDYFSGVEFHYCCLDKSSDVYCSSVPEDIEFPEYGWKSGPSLQFFFALKTLHNYGGYTLFLEPDVLPIKNGWLEKANSEISDSDTFWMKGTKYLGKTKLVSEIAEHLNGVAIYKVEDKSFQNFVSEKWKPILKTVVSERPFVAYDACLAYAKYHTEINERSLLSAEDLSTIKERFLSSPFIQNHTGKHERQNNGGIPLLELSENPETYLLHGRHLFKELIAFGVNYDTLKAQVRKTLQSKTLDIDAYCVIINQKYEKLKIDPPSRLTVRANDADSRILDVMLCPYNKDIPRVSNAGTVREGRQVMHNGLEVGIDSYYPWLVVPMLKLNAGVHEPEEEAYFHKVLKYLQKEQVQEQPVIIELGCYWAFYSMWFLKEIPKGKAYLVEPELERMKAGQNNFKINGFEGDWTQDKVGKDYLQIDDYIDKKKLDVIDILHSDIQGAEVEMLRSAQLLFVEKRVRFTFISTHSNEIHQECLDILKSYGYYVIYEVDMTVSRCFDGVIVASRNEKIDLNLSKVI